MNITPRLAANFSGNCVEYRLTRSIQRGDARRRLTNIFRRAHQLPMKKLVLLLSLLLFSAAIDVATASQADDTSVTIGSKVAGAKPFISKVSLTVSNPAVLDRVKFSIAPRRGSVTRPVAATYTRAYLEAQGYATRGSNEIIVPVFGLYDGRTNAVTFTYFFADGSHKSASTTITTANYADPCEYQNVTVLKPRTRSKDLNYDFIMVATQCCADSPRVIDTDGVVRWVGTADFAHSVAGFFDNAAYLSDNGVVRIDLDGTVTRLIDLATLGARDLHHSMDRGKHGIILDINTEDWVESVNVEIDESGNILKKWVLGDIIRKAMIAGGDDPTPFVRNANGRYDFNAFEDWFHNNSTAYRKSDDSLIISSRENFVICIDYDTSAIKWILGDPTKQWYQYPSLRKYALTLAPGTHAPAGQHAVSVTADDQLLLFDNGQPSQNHQPYGQNRGFSALRRYAIDLKNRVATEVWTYVTDPPVKAGFRSSVYEDAPLNYLAHYDVGQQRIFGLSARGEKVFDYRFPGPGFRSLPVHWENLTFPPTEARLSNISARAQVNTGDAVSITGFIISGQTPKTVVVRGLGTSLQADGKPLPGRLLDPALQLRNRSGALLQQNDNYKASPNLAAIQQAGLAPHSDSEAAILATLQPGSYTAILRGSHGATGIGLAEVFDLNPGKGPEIANLSSRAFTSSGDNVLIGGVILEGNEPKRVLFRALGPELAKSGVDNALPDPALDLYNADGTQIATNDNWRAAGNAADIQSTGIAPRDEREAAILMRLPAGRYTFIARGSGGGSGIALVEAFRLD